MARRIIDEVPSGRLYKDGSLLVNAQSRSFAARRRLSFAGIVTVALAWSEKGALVADPEIELIGIPETDKAGESMTEIALDAVEEAFEVPAEAAPARSGKRYGSGTARGARGHRRALEQKTDLPRPPFAGLGYRFEIPGTLEPKSRYWRCAAAMLTCCGG